MKCRRRPPVRQDEIIGYIRSAILRGALGSGERLPPRTTYEEKFEVSSVTVQRAFDRLISDGFLDTRGKNGTFVTEHPPHLWRIGIALQNTLDDEAASRLFYEVVVRAAERIEAQGGRSLPVYMEMDEHVRSEGCREILRDIRAHTLAGIVFVGRPRLSPDNPILSEGEAPRVVMTSSPHPIPGLLRVDLGGETGFTKRALEYLASKGRRRVAQVVVGGIEPERLEFFGRYSAELGLRTEPYWVQGVEITAMQWATNVAHLLFHGGQSDRPDGLIISDDNLVEYTCRGLVQAGVRVPEDVEVVAHCNFPAPSPSVLRLARLGYDARLALGTCLDLIDARNRGETVPECTMVPPHFEWEIEPHR